MPSHEPQEKTDKYTLAPLIIWEVLTYTRLEPLQSQLINFFIGNSLNVFGKKQNIHARKWVPLHTTNFSSERGYSNQGVREAASSLVKYGLLERRESFRRTNSGVQKGYEYRLTTQQKLEEILDVLSSAAKVQGSKPDLLPQNVDKSRGSRPDLLPRKALLATSQGPTCYLARPYLLPWGVKLPKSLKNLDGKYSLNTFKDFLNTFGEFQNSFLELYNENAKSKAARFKNEMQIGSIISQYGLYSVYIAMSVNLFSKDAEIGDFEAIRAFLISNELKLKDYEERLKMHSDNIFNSILKIHTNLEIQNDLKIFKENFKASAGTLLLNKEFEQGSNEIFLYSSFPKDVISIFETCNFNIDRFTNELLKKLNLYFKAKILGIKGLSFA